MRGGLKYVRNAPAGSSWYAADADARLQLRLGIGRLNALLISGET